MISKSRKTDSVINRCKSFHNPAPLYQQNKQKENIIKKT